MIHYIYVFIIFIITGFFSVIIPVFWNATIGSINQFFIRKSIKKGSWFYKNLSVLYKDIHMDTIFVLRLMSGIMKLCCMAIRFVLPDCLELLLLLFIRILYSPKSFDYTVTNKLKAIRTLSYKLEEIWCTHLLCEDSLYSESETKNDKGETIVPLITLYQHRDKQSETYATFYCIGRDEGRSKFNITIWLSDTNTVKLEKMLEMVNTVNKKMCEKHFNDKINQVYNMTIERDDGNNAKISFNFEMDTFTDVKFNGAKLTLIPVL